MKTKKNTEFIKSFIVFFFSFASVVNIHAQDLTKEETVNYINKKIKETNGHYLTQKWSDEIGDLTLYYYSSDFYLKGDKIFYQRHRGTHEEKQNGKKIIVGGKVYDFYPCRYVEITDLYSFSPENIISIEKFNDTEYKNNPVGTLIITVSNNTAKLVRTFGRITWEFTEGNYSGQCANFEEERSNYSYDQIYLSYLKGDETNFNKLKKALEYLRDLAKAEDDPFGN